MSVVGSKERSFGLTVGVAFGMLATYQGWRGGSTPAIAFATVSAVLVILALVRPALLRRPSDLWRRMAQGLGWFNARVLLSVIFVVLITPLGIVLRLMGWDPLRLRRRRWPSGWAPYPAHRRGPTHYERMF